MIKEFSVKNFKCHEDVTYFDLPGLTLVSGTNNSGKSSFLQSIYLLTQNKSNRSPVLSLNEELKLGSFSHILNKNTPNSESIDFSIVFDEGGLNESTFSYLSCNLAYKNPSEYNFLTIYDIEDYPILDSIEINYCEKTATDIMKTIEFNLVDMESKYLYKLSGEIDTGYCQIVNLVPEQIIYEEIDMNSRKMCSQVYEEIRGFLYKLTTDNIHYLRALRLNDFIDGNTSLNTKLGLAGEYTAEVMNKKWEHQIDYFLDGKQLRFGEIFDIWVKKLLGQEYSIKSQLVDRDQYKVTVTDMNSKMDLTLDQVGFGISQILPILTLLFSSKKHDIILIENPEVHLHPKLQSLFIDICIEALKNQRKLIVETHSEHIVNRLRLNIKKSPQLLDDVNIYFFEKSTGEIICTKVEIDKAGKLDFWPENFFDQSYHDLMGLISDD